jgi:nucleoside-diphosphate kinase
MTLKESCVSERTLSIIKPDGTKRNLIGKIVGRFEEEGLRIAGMKMKTLSRKEAEGFYAVHKERPFFGELVDFMISGPVVIMCLEGKNAIQKNRDIMGATNPANAAPGTIRKLFSPSVGENTVHGSDAKDTAATEIAYFFSGIELN